MFFISYQVSGQVNTDSLINLLKTQVDSVKVMTLTELAWQFRNSDVDKSIEYALQGLELTDKKNYIRLKPKLLNILGVDYRNKGNYEDALKKFIETAQASQKVGNTEQLAYANQSIGDINNRKGAYGAAEIYVLKALSLFKSIDNQRGMAYCYYSMGLININKKEYYVAIYQLQKALKIRETIKDIQGMSACYTQLATIEQKRGKDNEALAYLEKAKTILEKHNDLRGMILLQYTISNVYLKKHDYKKAVDAILIALNISEKSGNLEYIKQCYQGLAKIYADSGHFEKAYQYQLKYIVSGDSLFNQQKSKQFLEMQEKFSSEKDSLQIQSLTEQTRQQNIFGIIAIFLIILLIIVVIFSLKLSRQYKVSNLRLESQTKLIQQQNFSLTTLNEETSIRNEVVEFQNASLSRLSKIQNKLFSIISHDFKNPLVSLYGSLFILESNDFSEEERKMAIDALKLELEQTSNLLDNILHWSLSQMKEEKINATNFNMLTVIEQNILLLLAQAEKKQIKINIFKHQETPVYADKEMINIVFRNLLHNAIKFSYENTTIFINILSAIDKPNMLIVSVKDFGKGISKQNQEKLFGLENYSSTGTAQEKGSGFGLLLCKDFVEKNGGRIWIHSEIDKGATFYFTVPIAE